MRVFPDEVKSVRLNERSNSSKLMYHKKYPNTDTSAYDSVLHALNKLYHVHYTLSFFVRNWPNRNCNFIHPDFMYNHRKKFLPCIQIPDNWWPTQWIKLLISIEIEPPQVFHRCDCLTERRSVFQHKHAKCVPPFNSSTQNTCMTMGILSCWVFIHINIH